MKIQSWFFLLLIYVNCSVNAHAQFTSQGVEYFIGTCSKEIFYKQSLENVRRYQNFEKSALKNSKNKVVIAKIVQENIMKEEDDLFLYRQQRNAKLASKDDKLRTSISDLSFDISRNSSLKVFLEYRIGGDDVRLKRRLYENCLGIVNEMINSPNN